MFWWTFVVATVLARGIGWFGNRPDDFGWAAYTPQSEMPLWYADYVPADGFEAVDGVSLVAFCLVVVVAVVEAVAAGRIVPGVVTVAVPFAAAALIWCVLPRGHPSFFSRPIPALVVILAAVAIRELWERRFAPTVGARTQSE